MLLCRRFISVPRGTVHSPIPLNAMGVFAVVSGEGFGGGFGLQLLLGSCSAQNTWILIGVRPVGAICGEA